MQAFQFVFVYFPLPAKLASLVSVTNTADYTSPPSPELPVPSPNQLLKAFARLEEKMDQVLNILQKPSPTKPEMALVLSPSPPPLQPQTNQQADDWLESEIASILSGANDSTTLELPPIWLSPSNNLTQHQNTSRLGPSMECSVPGPSTAYSVPGPSAAYSVPGRSTAYSVPGPSTAHAVPGPLNSSMLDPSTAYSPLDPSNASLQGPSKMVYSQHALQSDSGCSSQHSTSSWSHQQRGSRGYQQQGLSSTGPYGMSSPAKAVARFPGKNLGSLRELTVALARDVVFGDEVLSRSSRSGRNDTNQLDQGKMKFIRSIVRGRVGLMGDSEFDLVWRKCLDSLGKCCSKLKAKRMLEYK